MAKIHPEAMVSVLASEPSPGRSDGQQGARELDEKLVEAAKGGGLEEVKELLERRANIETVDDFLGQTPLFFAASRGHHEVVKLLLERRAEVDAKGRFEQTPLHWVLLESRAEPGHHQVARLLLEWRAAPDVIDEDGHTPLRYAIWRGSNEFVDMITDEVVRQNSWSLRLLLEIIAESNQDLILKVIEEWPQEAKDCGETLDRAALPERLRPVVAPSRNDPHNRIQDCEHCNLSDQNFFWLLKSKSLSDVYQACLAVMHSAWNSWRASQTHHMTASSRQMQCRPWSWQHGCSIVHSHCWKSEPASRPWCVYALPPTSIVMDLPFLLVNQRSSL